VIKTWHEAEGLGRSLMMQAVRCPIQHQVIAQAFHTNAKSTHLGACSIYNWLVQQWSPCLSIQYCSLSINNLSIRIFKIHEPILVLTIIYNQEFLDEPGPIGHMAILEHENTKLSRHCSYSSVCCNGSGNYHFTTHVPIIP